MFLLEKRCDSDMTAVIVGLGDSIFLESKLVCFVCVSDRGDNKLFSNTGVIVGIVDGAGEEEVHETGAHSLF